MFRDISAWHLALILLAFVVLFGYKKLPDATRSLGRSMRIFKSEVKGLHDDEPKQVEAASATPAPSQPSTTQTPTTQTSTTPAAANPSAAQTASGQGSSGQTGANAAAGTAEPSETRPAESDRS